MMIFHIWFYTCKRCTHVFSVSRPNSRASYHSQFFILQFLQYGTRQHAIHFTRLYAHRTVHMQHSASTYSTYRQHTTGGITARNMHSNKLSNSHLYCDSFTCAFCIRCALCTMCTVLKIIIIKIVQQQQRQKWKKIWNLIEVLPCAQCRWCVSHKITSNACPVYWTTRVCVRTKQIYIDSLSSSSPST